MKMEFTILGKNYYDMDGNRGASVLLFGDFEETNNSAGISISNANIDYNDHLDLKIFPAKYSAKFKLVSQKNRSGKVIPSIKLSDLQFIEKLEFVGMK